MWARSPARLAHEPLPSDALTQPVEVVGERARLELRALDALPLARARARPRAPRPRARARPRRRRRRRARRTSPGRIVRAADLHRLVDRAGHVLVRAAHPHPARPDRQAELASSSTSRTAASTSRPPRRGPSPGWRAGRRRSATGRGSGMVSTSTSPGSSLGHRRVHHQVVVPARSARSAPARPRAIRGRPGQVERRQAAPRPDGLVDRRRAERAPARRRRRAHSSGTTCGRTRWNASA